MIESRRGIFGRNEKVFKCVHSYVQIKFMEIFYDDLQYNLFIAVLRLTLQQSVDYI